MACDIANIDYTEVIGIERAPVISVIIPTYNCAAYIGEAIGSVLGQTYSDYEIVVVDDGSSDNTSALVKRTFPNVRYFRTKNSGVASARNLGISVSRGALIAFLDADDKWLPQKLEKQVELFEKEPGLGMVFTENHFFDESGIREIRACKRERLMSNGDLVKNIFCYSHVVTSSVMVRREVLDSVGLFEEGLPVAEDDNLWMRIAMGYRVALIDEPLLMYRVTAGSLSRTPSNIYVGVKRHIDLISTRYPEIRSRLGRWTIRRKHADMLFDIAYYDFTFKRYREARINFIESFRQHPLKFKSLLYLLSTFLSSPLIAKLQRIKQCLRET